MSIELLTMGILERFRLSKLSNKDYPKFKPIIMAKTKKEKPLTALEVEDGFRKLQLDEQIAHVEYCNKILKEKKEYAYQQLEALKVLDNK